MDINRIIGELRTERDRLTGIITALERLQTEGGVIGTPKRRGRKFMDKKARREVSERMKRYWAERRTSAHNGVSPELAGGSGPLAPGHPDVRTTHANVAA